MPTTFANTIDGNEILAKRSQCDYAGNDIQTTYAAKSELPSANQLVPTSTSADANKVLTVNSQGNAEWSTAAPGGVTDVEVDGTSVVSGGVASITMPTVDQTYNAASTNAQSGVAVASAISTKQDTVSDLATIRSGAALGATAVQPGDLATVATTGAYSDLTGTPTIPTATSDLNNDSGFITLSDVPAQVNADWNSSSGASEILNKPTIPSGVQLVPAATSADADKVLTVDSLGVPGWAVVPAQSTGLFEAVYGRTSYSDITQAISDKKIVYCRISATGASRMAFLAYIGKSNVEFQYYRSLSSHSASNMTDEVYVYTVDSSGWTTTTRNTGVKVTAGTHMSQSYSNDTLTLNATWPTVDQTYDASSSNAQSGTAVAEAIATKEDAFDVGTGLEMDTSGATPTLQVEAPVDIVAGPGIAIDNPDGNTLRVSQAYPTDETVLWNNNRVWCGSDSVPGTKSGTLSETVSNFERIRVYFARNNDTNLLSGNTSEFDTGEITTKGGIFISTIFINAASGALFSAHTFLALSGLTFTETMGSQWKQSDNNLDTRKVYLHPYKIVGIHRIANN